MDFWKCAVYLVLVGVGGFVVGRLLPAEWFRAEKFPFRTFPFENGGRSYEKLRIRKWYARLPDMSRILPGVMPPKRLDGDYRERLPELIRETCVAETVHCALGLLGLRCVRLWKGAGGWVVAGLNFLGNAAYVIVQRYNRPRLVRLMEKCAATEVRLEGSEKAHESIDLKL